MKVTYPEGAPKGFAVIDCGADEAERNYITEESLRKAAENDPFANGWIKEEE